jgi:hypothetical protein
MLSEIWEWKAHKQIIKQIVEKNKGGDMIGEKRSKNDQRSDALNPTSREHKAAIDNRSNQMN